LGEGTETTEGTKSGFAAGALGVEMASDFARGVAAEDGSGVTAEDTEDTEDAERGFEGGVDWGAGMVHFAVGAEVVAGVEVLE
jgi:hypothetical protein